MESVVYDDSPLAEYLEGAGTSDAATGATDHSENPNATSRDGQAPNADFAPRGLPMAGKPFKSILPHPVRVVSSRDGRVAGLLDAFSRVVGVKPAASEDAKFIERFRYILAASQLLDENTSQATWRTASNDTKAHIPLNTDFGLLIPNNAIATGVAALALVWLVYWSRWKLRANSLTKRKVVVMILMVAVVAVAIYAYARRQLLIYLRNQAFTAGSVLIANLQSFDASTANAIQHIQEVELVGRGYRLSMPMAPVSRIEQGSQAKRCLRLRRSLQRAYSSTLPVISEACSQLHRIVDEDDLERYLDVYDINNEDVQEAAAGWKEDEFDDPQSIRALRVLQFRFTTLRRLFLCSLISLEADSTNADYVRWHVAGTAMHSLATCSCDHAERINRILTDDDSLDIQSPTSPSSAVPSDVSAQTSSISATSSNPTRERLRKQFRSLAILSTGIRSIQAKMQILREDSQSILAGPSRRPRPSDTADDDVNDDDIQLADLGNSLLTHYDAIGSDLKSLIQAWESGRTGLALSLDRAERRISRASAVSSAGPRSPTLSLGGLTAVDEMLVGGGPLDALAALEGVSPSVSDRGRSEDRGLPSPRLRISTSTDISDSAADSASVRGSTPGSGVEEVFEGIAAPRLPKILGTPQERAQRLLDERKRRESRNVGAQMIRELESVLSGGARSNGDGSQRSSRRSSGFSSPVRTSFFPRASSGDGERKQSPSTAAAGLPRSNSVSQRDGAIGRRRPYSMYNIAPPTSQQRVTSL